MYAFTAIDPDFKPKGSRDPLGFQPLWAEVGRKLIKDLSTVSGNINDFKILCFAKYFFHHIKEQKDERLFLPFFLRVEQAFAYARRKFNNESSFNGNNFISKNVGNDTYTLSNEQRDCILSNQRTYGISPLFWICRIMACAGGDLQSPPFKQWIYNPHNPLLAGMSPL